MSNPRTFGYVYLVRNSVNGKVYIGKTTQAIRTRWVQHCSVSKNRDRSILHNAIRKYGRDAFTVVELGRAFTENELNEMERRCIWSHDSTNRAVGYNLTAGGEGVTGYKASPETRDKVSQAAKAMWERPGFRDAQKAGRRARYQDPKALAAHVQAMRGFCNDPAYKAKHRSNTSALWDDPEYRAKHRAGLSAAMQSSEYRAKQGTASRQRWSDPEWKRQVLEGRTAARKQREIAKQLQPATQGVELSRKR